MTTGFTQLVLGSQASFAGLTAASALAKPGRFASRFGLDATHPSGANEIRSQYGGFFAATAVVLLMALMGTVPAATGLVIIIMIFGGLLAGGSWVPRSMVASADIRRWSKPCSRLKRSSARPPFTQ